jgi:hypothetical protein
MFIVSTELSNDDFISLKTQLLILCALSEQTRVPMKRFLLDTNMQHWGIPSNCLPVIRKCVDTIKMLYPIASNTMIAALAQDNHPYISRATKATMDALHRF